MRQATSLKEGGKGAKRHFKQTDKSEFKDSVISPCYFGKDSVYCVGKSITPAGVMGSDGSAAGGGYSDQSEWQRSADDAAAPSARKMPGTATGRQAETYKIA